MQSRRNFAKLRLDSVLSNAKLLPDYANSCKRRSMMRPASNATVSGAYADSPTAIWSAFSNSKTPNAPLSKNGAAVDLPAPFGPAMTTTVGFLGGVDGLMAMTFSATQAQAARGDCSACAQAVRCFHSVLGGVCVRSATSATPATISGNGA